MSCVVRHPERAKRVEARHPERAQRVEARHPERAQRVEGAAVISGRSLDCARDDDARVLGMTTQNALGMTEENFTYSSYWSSYDRTGNSRAVDCMLYHLR